MTGSSRLRGQFGALLVAGAVAVVAVASTAPAGAVDAAQPLRVLVVGNSVASTLARGSPLAEELHGIAALPDLEVTDRIILACGISSLPQVCTTRRHWSCPGSNAGSAA